MLNRVVCICAGFLVGGAFAPVHGFEDKGLYGGASIDAVYNFSRFKAHQKSSAGTFDLNKSKAKDGYGASLFLGWAFKSGFWTLSPELDLKMDDGYHKQEFNDGEALATIHKRPINLSASLIAAYPIADTYDIQGIAGINIGQFKFEGVEKSASASAMRRKQTYYNLGFVIGTGVEKKFKTWAIGCTIKQNLYLKKKMNYTDSDGDRWQSKYRAASTNLSLRFRFPF